MFLTIPQIQSLLNSKAIFVFDFDGVLADSVNIKTDAFSKMYEAYGSEVQRKVVQHHLLNGGMSRYEKFFLYHKDFLNIKLEQNEIIGLADKFSDLVVNKVVNASEINGVSEFLNKFCINNKRSFIISATPESEIKEIVRRRKMDKFFQDIYGSPASKSENLRSLMSAHFVNANDILFFGDALADYNASLEVGCDFIGIGKEINDILEGNETNKLLNCGLAKDFMVLL